MTTSTAAGTETKHALWFKPADPLIRALTNGLLFAGGARTLPMLAALKFEFDGNQLEVLATDRYRASIETVGLDPQIEHAGQAPFDFLLPRESAASALKLLKANKRDPILLTFDSEAGTVTFKALETTSEYRTFDGSFPPMRQLYPDPANAIAVNPISFNPQFLADLGRVQTENGVSSVSILTFGSAPKPVLIEYTDGPRVLLVPLKPKDGH